jgi:peptidoglycan/LPS O-acetylase OafA/YrhL
VTFELIRWTGVARSTGGCADSIQPGGLVAGVLLRREPVRRWFAAVLSVVAVAAVALLSTSTPAVAAAKVGRITRLARALAREAGHHQRRAAPLTEER